MKKIILASLFAAATAMSGQSLIAGWDFDDVNANATSINANWGQSSATLSWTHAVADFVTTFDNGFAINSVADDTTVAGDSFSFLDNGTDSATGYSKFSQNDLPGTAKQGFRSDTASDTLSLSFDTTGYTDIKLVYSFDSGTGYSRTSAIDLNAATYSFTAADGGSYDNFAVYGTVVPEPSTYALIFGLAALVIARVRSKK